MRIRRCAAACQCLEREMGRTRLSTATPSRRHPSVECRGLRQCSSSSHVVWSPQRQPMMVLLGDASLAARQGRFDRTSMDLVTLMP